MGKDKIQETGPISTQPMFTVTEDTAWPRHDHMCPCILIPVTMPKGKYKVPHVEVKGARKQSTKVSKTHNIPVKDVRVQTQQGKTLKLGDAVLSVHTRKAPMSQQCPARKAAPRTPSPDLPSRNLSAASLSRRPTLEQQYTFFQHGQVLRVTYQEYTPKVKELTLSITNTLTAKGRVEVTLRGPEIEPLLQYMQKVGGIFTRVCGA